MNKTKWAALVAGTFLGAVSVTHAETLRYAYPIDPNSLDPYALAETFTLSWLANMYEPLVMRDQSLAPAPGLAQSWENTEPTVWRFHLREGVTFHGGESFSADDVVFSLNRVRAEGSDMGHNLASVVEIVKVDDHTVDLVTGQPNPILPLQITGIYMMSKSWAEENDAVEPSSVQAGRENFATTNMNGTGPFMIEDRQRGVRTVMVPNPDWWGTPEHNLSRVVFTPIQSDATRVSALLSGEVDMIYPVPLQDVPRLNETDGVSVLEGPDFRTLFLSMDQTSDELSGSDITDTNPLKDRRVRQAIYQAIDVESIRDRIMGGASVPAGLMVGPALNGFVEELNDRLPFDPDTSQALLEEAGYPNGFSMEMDCSNDRYVNDALICPAIVGMLARVGIRVDLNAQTRTQYFEKVLSRDTTMSLLGWGPLSFDGHSTLMATMHTPDGTKGSYNVGGYSNPRIDELTDLIEFEVDPEQRQAYFTEAWTIHKDEIGHIPLHQQSIAWGLRDGVDVVQRADDSFVLNWVTVNAPATD